METKLEILQRRKEIEQELVDLLEKTGSDFDLEDIKEIIYNENGQDSLTDIIAMFDNGQDVAELENVLELVNEAWNYFPHKILAGLSPVEKTAGISKNAVMKTDIQKPQISIYQVINSVIRNFRITATVCAHN